MFNAHYALTEWEFVQGLAFKEQTPADADFIRMMYTSRLRKYKHAEEHALARKKLVEDYGLGDNPDVLFSFADALYSNFRWADCFAITPYRNVLGGRWLKKVRTKKLKVLASGGERAWEVRKKREREGARRDQNSGGSTGRCDRAGSRKITKKSRRWEGKRVKEKKEEEAVG